MTVIKNILKNNKAAILLSAVAGFTLLIYAPADIYLSNYMDFAFDIYDLLKYMPVIFLVFTAAATVVFCLIKKCSKKIWPVILAIAFAGFLSLYIQGTFFSSNLPLIDGNEIDWAQYDRQRITSIIIWGGFLSASLGILFFVKKARFEKTVAAVAGILGVYMIVSLALLCFSAGNGLHHKRTTCMTADSMLEMSRNQNFIILLVDGIDGETFSEVIGENPEYREIFRDFTSYTNTMGGYAYTTKAVPFILFGSWYDNSVYYPYWIRDSIEASPFMNRLAEEEYRKSVFFEYIERANLDAGMFENFKNVTEFNEPVKFCKMVFKLVGMRYMPYDAKKYCVLTPDDIYFDTLKTNKNDHIDYYDFENSAFYQRLNNTDVTYTDKNCFRFLYCSGAHAPFIYDENVERIQKGTYELSIKASIKITDTYLQKLKDAGVYDNSVIVILADHGMNTEHPSESDKKQNPFLLIKGINESHSFAENDAPISHADLQDAYLKLMNGAKGSDCFSWKAGDQRERRYMYSDVLIADPIYEYIQSGHASDESTLIPTGNVYEFDGQCIIDRQELEKQKGTMNDIIF